MSVVKYLSIFTHIFPESFEARRTFFLQQKESHSLSLMVFFFFFDRICICLTIEKNVVQLWNLNWGKALL